MVDDRPQNDRPGFDKSKGGREDSERDASFENNPLRFDSKQSNQNRIHLLEMELRRIRKEASAARLEARAAELEIEIERLTKLPNSHFGVIPDTELGDSLKSRAVADSAFTGFESWDEVRATQLRNRDVSDPAVSRLRFDTASTPKHHLDRSPLPGRDDVDECDPNETASGTADAGSGSRADQDESVEEPAAETVSQQPPDEEPSFTGLVDVPSSDTQSAIALAEVAVDGDQQSLDRPTRKSRPMAMIISAVLHIAVIIILAGWTLSSHRPKDQVSISASVATASEVSMETFSLETSEPEVEPTEPTESETEYDLSPIGEIAVAEFSLDVAPSPPSSAAASMLSSSAAASSAAMTLDSMSDAKMQFCGVEGGGNHFVYLVDSSGSMGDSFDSARKELLNSIDFLKSDQRFYVIFFDANPDFMRLASSSQDEPRSVAATAKNKLALRRWAMRIDQDRGKNPYDVLEFALTLKPDVIFLLSDGEFPQRIEDLLKEKNHVENLFGDNGPMCIVHTIAYYSEEGESRMRRIAQQNGGQYRYVPRP